MADRKQQLLEALNKAEESDDTEVLDEEDAAEHSSDDPPLVEDESGEESEEKDAATGKETAEDDGKGLAEGGKKAKVAKATDTTGKSPTAEGVGKKTDAPKGAKKDPAAKTVDQTEKEAAEAVGEAPKAWKVSTREHWSKLPKEVREQVQQRETEITKFIGQHGAAIQHKAQFDELIEPFKPFIAAQQSTPMRAVHGLMTTAARLTTGAPQQKAAVVAEIMRNYGIDVKTLDEYLTAQMQGNPQQFQAQPTQERPPAWAQPILSFMQETTQARQARETRVNQEAAAELAAAEKMPFFSDLQEDIGLLMERAAKKNELMTIQQAYERARKMNPEVDAILTQREKAAKGNGDSAIVKARKAAATVRGAPGGGDVSKANGKANDGKILSRREQLAAAIDAQADE